MEISPELRLVLFTTLDSRRSPVGGVSSPTDEEDGEGDEEQEDVGHQVESVHEAAIVQRAVFHAVGIVVAAKRQGHATGRRLHTGLGVSLKKNTSYCVIIVLIIICP